ncbi:unannotated protein [freshwater metagenome]|uniref:Unannotated protein n=1 Tax=freshwater metagenome TaxID=449393 RepID=A0A6J6SNT6_9ZZZZ
MEPSAFLTKTAEPSTEIISSLVTPPGRKIVGLTLVQSTMVDSTPSEHAPPSSTKSISSPNSATTAEAEVGLTRPKRFADGAATPSPKDLSSACATFWAGTRKPILG